MNIHQAIDKARSVIRRQHKALATEDTYIFWLRRYIQAVQQMPPDLPSEKKLEQFLTDLACKHDVSACSQNQALNAVHFFYRDVLGRQLGNVNALRAQRPMHERPLLFPPQEQLPRPSRSAASPSRSDLPRNWTARVSRG